jgi:hypothetical protein
MVKKVEDQLHEREKIAPQLHENQDEHAAGAFADRGAAQDLFQQDIAERVHLVKRRHRPQNEVVNFETF